MPIQWRNINAPSFGAANLLSQSAGNRIGEGIEGLRNLAQNQADTIRAEEAQLTENNTQDVLNQIYGIQSMDEYNSAVESGTFDLEALDNTYGGKVNVGQIRDALLAQDNTIQDQENTRLTYENNVRQRKDSPIANQFIQDLYGSTSTSQVDALLSNLDNLGLSEEGQTTAVKAATDYKQQLLDTQYQNKLKAQKQLQFEQSQDDRAYNLEQRFIKDYNPEKTRTVVGNDGVERTEVYYPKLDASQLEANAQRTLADLPNKYSIPENFDDVVQSGTASDAVRAFVDSQDRDDIDVVGVQDTITDKLKTKEFEDSQGQTYTYTALPKWVVQQALQEITLEDPSWYNLTDWGKGNLSYDQEEGLTKSIQKNLELYGTLRDKQGKMEQEKAELNGVINKARISQLRLIQEAREEFQRNQSKNRNL